jgi:hypothetical protein
MIYKVQGTVKHVEDVETFEGRNGGSYSKQNIVVTEKDDRGYENAVALRAFGDTVAETEGLREGETVDVTFAINAREYNGRWYNDLNIIHVRIQGAAQNERRAATRAKIDDILDGTAAPHGEDDLPEF